MTKSALVFNAALLAAAILVPGLVQLARQGKSVEDYYDEEIYYDEKAVDGSADFSEDITYAQYDLGGTLLTVLRRVLERRCRLRGLHHMARRQRGPSHLRPAKVENRTVTPSASTEKNASQNETTVTTTKPGSRRIHVAKQQDVPTSKTVQRATTTTEKIQLQAPRSNVTGMCRIARSEAWRQVSLYSECLEIPDVKSNDRRMGEVRFLRRFRLASQTTEILWHYLLPHIPEDTRQTDCPGSNLSQTTGTTQFCNRSFQSAKETVRVLDTGPFSGDPLQEWHMVCRLVQQYKYCVSELVSGCHGIQTTEIDRKATEERGAVDATYCFINCASGLAATALWAVVYGIVSLCRHGP
ncbi:uncharacterized protein LOC144135229 isoform X2 [Amblyomma americanum]